MSQRWSRAELAHLVETRHRNIEHEGRGTMAFIEFRMKVTPELLAGMLGGTWTNSDGTVARFDGVTITDDGYVEPILHRLVR